MGSDQKVAVIWLVKLIKIHILTNFQVLRLINERNKRKSAKIDPLWRTTSFARRIYLISRLISSRFLSAPIHVCTHLTIMQFLGKEAGNVSFLSSVIIWACYRQHVPNTSVDIKSIPALVVFWSLDLGGEVTGAPLQVIGSRLETRTSQ